MLLTKKKWQIADVGYDRDEAVINVLLKNRGIESEEDVREFLSDNPVVWHDPFLFNDMRKAVDIIAEAIDSRKKILVYGDYDCDGVTATSILVRYFKSHNCDVEYIVPHRSEHGYGLTDQIIDKVIARNPDLLITVDCGITNIDTVKILKDKGVKVIVSDHHNVQETIPDADAVICAKRSDNTYPFTELCGAGVAMKIVEAMGRDGRFKVTPDIWKQTIELSGIATIADLVPLVNENRTLVKKAFKSMQKPSNLGVGIMIKKLLDHGKSLDETFISFNFVPRINAAGRLYDSSDALKLFLEDTPSEVTKAAENLTKQNDERKEIESVVFEEAVKQVENTNRPEEWSLTNTVGPVVVYGSGWHQGVLGIVAGKLTAYFRRPAIVFTEDSIDPTNVKGSGRSYGDFDLFGVIEKISDTVVNFGGHKKAAGLVVKKSDIGRFMRALEAESRRYLGEKDDAGSETGGEVLDIDMEVPFDEVTFETYKKVSSMKPFGIGNVKPLFVTRDLIIADVNSMSDGSHIRLDLIDGSGKYDKNKTLSAVGFGMGEFLNVVKAGDRIDIVYSMNEFTFRGDTGLSLHLSDIKPAMKDSFVWQKAEIPEKLYQSALPLDQIAKMSADVDVHNDLIPSSEQYATVYRVLSKFIGDKMSTCDMDLLALMVNSNSNTTVTPFQLKRCLEVFSEAGLIKYGNISPLRVCFAFVNNTDGGKVSLRDTDTFKRLDSNG